MPESVRRDYREAVISIQDYENQRVQTTNRDLRGHNMRLLVCAVEKDARVLLYFRELLN